ncbi:MAG: TnsA endonuclease N-terminal domain-containing protein [Oryzomonas sp.]|uniref:TnsA endonuclease N-terminal domain-containing protein n=1 Tax=Oryzomonas sp. TaxID=2855186 RepID=UPI00283B763A|nr:TnsA endonuclease N-terminal domain-containing protein [Oryzomonas sp.]MDR3579208.1 TnsA endonuclease N-terminal domain-containing protein [Oryzomonas sp.]
MPRRKTSTAANKLKKGRGQGHGQSYTPFLYTREVPSLGKASRIKGWKTGRVHHFLSTLESDYFYALEWFPVITDIREQFPLPLDATQKIAERLSIWHHQDPKNKEPCDVTTDFLIDVEIDGNHHLIARTVKPSSDLNNSRIIEKFEIERTYWHEQGVDWGIVTEREIPKALARNVEWVHSALDPAEAPGIKSGYIPFIESALFEELANNPSASVAQVGMEIDSRLGLRGGTALWVVKHLIASRQWEVDMMTRIEPHQPLAVVRAGVATTLERMRQ